MISFNKTVLTGMTVGGTILGSVLYNRSFYGLSYGVIHSAITIGIRELLGKKASALYLAGVVIYAIGSIGRKALTSHHVSKPKTWTAQDRIQIAKETLQCIKQGYYLNSKQERVALQSANTLYDKSSCFSDTSSIPNTDKYEKTEIIVVNQDCIEAAQNHVQQGASVALLNFASPIEPGGGFEEGANGQEEQLCYSSELAGFMKEALIKSTSSDSRPFFPMNNHQDVKYGSSKQLEHFNIVYTPNVSFFRSNAAHHYSFLDTPFKVGVISSAAPVEPQWKVLEDGSIDYADEHIKNYLRTTITLQLYAATAYLNEHDTVILGAFGCGAFKNPPQAVAKIYKEIIDAHFKGAFKKIVFAIVDDPYKGPHNPQGNLKPFEECFKTNSFIQKI